MVATGNGMNLTEIRKAITAATYGRGPYVFGTDCHNTIHRITAFKVKRGLEYGRKLNGDWFVMYSWQIA